ncbi:Flp pilus assembly complex ATPase component TadA, partial [Desulfobulbus sp. F3]|nr:Flp pilus assembly complex ATPase component TadA [Desulfobulbus sp. F3]
FCNSKFKVLGKLVFDQKEQPQGGSFSVIYDDGNKLHHIDYRISLIPTRYGESVVLRVLDQTMMENMKIDDLGVTGDVYKNYSRQITKTNGLIFIAGPTGSGKTTTLYATIKSIAGDKKIITIEDPIEYIYPDEYAVTQTQVNENRGVGFDELMGELIHHDPDVIVIGEIRSKKSCELAVEAARTGHLVFSTIHAEDSTSIIPRMRDMIDMKSEDFLGQTKAVIAQRLIKRICFYCAEKFIPDSKDIEYYFGEVDQDFDFYHGSGCKLCNYSGFWGRIGIYELWMPTRKTISELRYYAGSDYEIRQAAITGGLKPFYLAGIDLMKQGKITLDKAVRSIPNIAIYNSSYQY